MARRVARRAGHSRESAPYNLSGRCFQGQHELCPITVNGKEAMHRVGFTCFCECHEEKEAA